MVSRIPDTRRMGEEGEYTKGRNRINMRIPNKIDNTKSSF